MANGEGRWVNEGEEGKVPLSIATATRAPYTNYINAATEERENPLQTIQEITFFKIIDEFKEEINNLKKFIHLQVPLHIQTVTKNMLKPKGEPFDPSQYDWKPTPEELKNLERIMLEES